MSVWFWSFLTPGSGSTVCGSGGQRHTQSFHLEDLFRISVWLEGTADMLVFVLARGSLMRRDKGFSSWDQNSHPVILSLSWVQHLGSGSTADTWELQVERYNLKLRDDICKKSQRAVMNPWCCSRQTVDYPPRCVRAVAFTLTTAALL